MKKPTIKKERKPARTRRNNKSHALKMPKQYPKAVVLLYEYFVMTIGTLLVAIGTYYFKYPNNFATGGVTGLSIVVGKITTGITPAQFVFIADMILLVVGFIFLGKTCGARTVYCSVLLSVFLAVFEYISPNLQPLSSQPLMDLMYSIFLPAIGSAMIFNLHGSTGGSDIIALIINKWFKMEVGKALFVADIGVVIVATFVFGIETGLYSLLGVLAQTFFIDSAIEMLNQSKYFIIITDFPDEISKYITETLDRGATKWESEGCYSGVKKSVVLVAMNRFQARKLRAYIKTVDRNAFVLISNTSDIIGNGFRQIA